MVAAAELSVRRLRVVLRMVVRKRIFEWKSGRVVKDRALSIVGNLQFILLLTRWFFGKMWVRETWTIVEDLKFPSFLLSNLLCRPVVSFTTYTRYVYVLYPIWSSSPTRNLSTPLLPSFICRYAPDLGLGSGLPCWLRDFMKNLSSACLD
jgi:hypothetical protein